MRGQVGLVGILVALQAVRLDQPSCAPLYFYFSRQLFSQNQKASRRLDPKADLISPDFHHHNSYLVPKENFFVFLQGQN
jgi:hypothetical protein